METLDRNLTKQVKSSIELQFEMQIFLAEDAFNYHYKFN